MTETTETDARPGDDALRQTAARIVGRVMNKTVLLTIAAMVVVFAARLARGGSGEWWEAQAGVLFGAALGLLNFRWLASTAERFYAKRGMTPGRGQVIGILISVLKLSAIFVVLFVVIRWKLLSIIAVVGGLSVCFAAILWEGLGALTRGIGESGSPPKA